MMATASSERPSPQSTFLQNADMQRLSFKSIAVNVGPADNNRTFDIDQRPLIKHSRFFAIMLSGPWREARSKSVNLTEDDPDIFAIFALFIHTGKIFSTRDGDIEIYPDGSRRDKEWARLARAWVLGDKLQATAFKEAIADAICDKVVLDRKWPLTLHQIIYSSTTPAVKGVRRLCVDIAVAKWDARTLKCTMRDEEWSEFFEDVAVRLLALRKRGEKCESAEIEFGEPGCRYHAHVAEGTACWSSMEFL